MDLDRNADRRAAAISALDRHSRARNGWAGLAEPDADRLTDLLADLKHAYPEHWEAAVRKARMHHAEETYDREAVLVSEADYATVNDFVQAQPLSDGSGWCLKAVPGQIVGEFYGPDAKKLAENAAVFWNIGLLH